MRFFYLYAITAFLISSQISYSQEVLQRDSSLLNSVLDTIKSNESSNQVMELLVKESFMKYKDSLQRETIKDDLNKANSLAKKRKLEQELHLLEYNDSLKLVDLNKQIERLKKEAIPYPAVIGEDTLRIFYTSYGALSAKEREERYIKRIKDAVSTFILKKDTIVAISDGLNYNVMFNDDLLTTITPADAMWVGKDIKQMSNNIALTSQDVINIIKERRSLFNILRQIGLSLLVLIVCGGLIYLINNLFSYKMKRYLTAKENRWFNGIKIKDYEFLSPHKELSLILFVIKILRLFVSLVLLYITLPLLFSIFPFTKKYADLLFDWVAHPIGFIFRAIIDYIPNLFVIIIIWLTIKYLVRGIKYMTNEIANGHLKINGFYPDWAPATYNIIRFLIYAFGFVVMFPYLPGSDSSIFKGVSVFVGVIFSLGSTSAISNIVAGLVLTYMRPFKVGDHIKIADTLGDVLEKTPFVTRIKTKNNEIVTIPNSTVLSTSVINYTTTIAEQGVIFNVSITIGYDVPWRKVHQMMIDAALRSNYILKQPTPYVLQTSLDDFYVSYQLCAYSKNPDKQARIYSELNQNIQDVFAENNVEIMSPHYKAFRNGNASTIPHANN